MFFVLTRHKTVLKKMLLGSSSSELSERWSFGLYQRRFFQAEGAGPRGMGLEHYIKGGVVGEEMKPGKKAGHSSRGVLEIIGNTWLLF